MNQRTELALMARPRRRRPPVEVARWVNIVLAEALAIDVLTELKVASAREVGGRG